MAPDAGVTCSDARISSATLLSTPAARSSWSASSSLAAPPRARSACPPAQNPGRECSVSPDRAREQSPCARAQVADDRVGERMPHRSNCEVAALRPKDRLLLKVCVLVYPEADKDLNHQRDAEYEQARDREDLGCMRTRQSIFFAHPAPNPKGDCVPSRLTSVRVRAPRATNLGVNVDSVLTTIRFRVERSERLCVRDYAVLAGRDAV
jgi:hypothetical protein